MPTGYTYGIEDGKITTAKDFLMLCARNFDACFSMRDESFDAEIPEKFEKNAYYEENIKREQEELNMWINMTPEESHEKYEEYIKSKNDNAEKELIKLLNNNKSYIKIFMGISNWTPPTPDHECLKEFALNQLNMSMEDINFAMERLWDTIKTNENYNEWLKNNIILCKESIEYYKKSDRDETTRIERRNKWIEKLRESLKYFK